MKLQTLRSRSFAPLLLALMLATPALAAPNNGGGDPSQKWKSDCEAAGGEWVEAGGGSCDCSLTPSCAGTAIVIGAGIGSCLIGNIFGCITAVGGIVTAHDTCRGDCEEVRDEIEDEKG